MRRSTRLVALVATVMATTMLGAAGWAFFTATGSGSGSATVATLSAPTQVTATQPNAGVGTVHLTWTAPAAPGGGAVEGFFVQRTGTTSGDACGSSAASLVTPSSCDDTGLAPGTYSYTVTAVWRSWTATSAPSDPAAVTVSTTASTTTGVVSTTESPSVAGQTVTYTATVSVTAPGSGTPTGNVEFLDGGLSINVCGDDAGNPLSGATATCLVTYSKVGSHTITARYLGGAGYDASPASPAITQLVNQASPTTALTLSSASTTYGSENGVTFTASVTAPFSGTPTGSVTVKQGSTPLCTITLPAASCASTATALAANASPYSVVAVYSGDTNFVSSTSSAQVLTVNKAVLGITASNGTMTYGATAPTITASYAGFVSGEGTANLSVLPTCSTAATTSSNVGTYASSCSGAAAVNYAPDYVAGSVTVTQASQTISITSTAPSNATVNGAAYTVTATGGASGNAVTFTIDSSATAVCSISGSTVSFTATGTCKINANQAGNINYAPASQAQQSFTVSSKAPVIGGVVRDNNGNTKVKFTGTATAGASITVTICKVNDFPCTTGNIAGNAGVATVASNGSWLSTQSSANLDLGTNYYAQAVQSGPAATSAVFSFTVPS